MSHKGLIFSEPALTDIVGVMDITGVTDIMGVKDITWVTDITGGIVQHMASTVSPVQMIICRCG